MRKCNYVKPKLQEKRFRKLYLNEMWYGKYMNSIKMEVKVAGMPLSILFYFPFP